MKVTSDNLIPMMPKLGAWTHQHLASMALRHYFPLKYKDEDNLPTVMEEGDMLHSMGFVFWQDVIEKYHKEVGYTDFELDNPSVINQY